VKPILLLDNSLQIDVFFSSDDHDLADNICVVILETCPEDEKIFKHEESHIFLTPQQARDLATALTAAVEKSEKESL
jgi:hypothetical protein